MRMILNEKERSAKIVLGKKKRISCLVVFFLCLFVYFPRGIYADKLDDSITDVTKEIDATVQFVEEQNFEQASEQYQVVKQWWTAHKQAVKQKNAAAAQQIDLKVGQASIALLTEDASKAQKELFALSQATQEVNPSEADSLTGYIKKLSTLEQIVQAAEWEQAQVLTEQLATEWLSVEGDVVSRSQTIYDNAEKNLLLLKNAVESQEQTKAATILSEMKTELTSIDSSDYSLVDVAMIPFREGLEALLIISLLLSVTKYQGATSAKKAKRWILSGGLLGIVTSLIIGVIVYYVLSVVTFGNNNNLINGYTGIFSSMMLVYVGIWMHKSSDVEKMTSFYREKSQAANTSRKQFGLALLAFLAIVREGLEIVIFLIGMVGKVSLTQLILGFALGLFLLLVVAIVLFVFERRLPLKLFFTLSSVVIFYLAIKFMGSGVHSLQLADQLPNQVESYLPTYTGLSIYPSWYSLVPQLVIIALIIGYLFGKRKKETIHEK